MRTKPTTPQRFPVKRTIFGVLLVATFVFGFPTVLDSPGWFRLDASVIGGPDVLR